ncbi:MAG: Hpt domain-containing protein [Chlorobiaceae bacterium]|nr:Hpt domain-containing protein [Chlorobiaceae bacterium]
MQNQLTEIFNIEDFLNRMMLDSDLARSILEEFLSELPGKLHSIERHVSQGNTREAAVVAHLIKGEAASVGAERMSRAAYAVELAAKADNIEELRRTFPSLEENASLFVKTAKETKI